LDPTGLYRSNDQSESGNRHGERVDIYTPHAVQRLLSRLDLVGLDLSPLPKQPGEAAEQEVPRAAGRADQPHLLQPEPVEGRGERPVEDELFYKDRRL